MMGMFRPESPLSPSSSTSSCNGASSSTVLLFMKKEGGGGPNDDNNNDWGEGDAASAITTFDTCLLWGDTTATTPLPPPTPMMITMLTGDAAMPPSPSAKPIERAVLLHKKEQEASLLKNEPHLYEFERALKMHFKEEHRAAMNRLLHDMDRTKVPSEIRRTKSAIVNLLLDGFYARSRPQASTFMQRFLLHKRKRDEEEARKKNKK